MQTEQFTVKNVKCGGCAANIQNGLKGQPGVGEVEVTVQSGTVKVTGEGLDRAQIAGKLAELGYPEAE